MDIEDYETPEDRRKKAKEKRREENRQKFLKAKEKSAVAVTARQPIGTKVGNKQRMQEFKEKLLTAHNGDNVIRKVLEIALNDEHPQQGACLKMCLDRMLPTSMFEDAKKGGDKPMISINITGIHDAPEINTGNVIDVNSEESGQG